MPPLHDLEPIDPSTARELYLDHKATHCTEATVRGHHYRTKHIVAWCEENGIDNLNELTGRHLNIFLLQFLSDLLNGNVIKSHLLIIDAYIDLPFQSS